MARAVRKSEAGHQETGGTPASRGQFYAKITDKGEETYDWKEVYLEQNGGTYEWKDVPDGLTGTAIEMSGIEANVDDVVLLQAETIASVTSGVTDYINVWGFRGVVKIDTLPAPTAQYQVLQCTQFTNADTYTIAFDWVRAH